MHPGIPAKALDETLWGQELEENMPVVEQLACAETRLGYPDKGDEGFR